MPTILKMKLLINILTLLIVGLPLQELPSAVVLAQGPFKEIRIFIDADKSLVDKAGGAQAASKFISELIAKVDAIYRKELGLTLSLAGMHLWTTEDPFSGDSLSSTLASFADYGESTYRAIYSYDVAHLLLGSGLGGAGGIAYQGTACGDTFSKQQAYGVSQPDLSDLYEFNAHLFAHELGHNLNAGHDELPACVGKSIMCLAQIGSNFSDQSKADISSYVSARNSAGCFPGVNKLDPISSVKVRATITKDTVNYGVTGAQSCTSLTLVGSPTEIGLSTIFGYLQIGSLTPAANVSASSKKAIAFKNSKQSKLFIGAYCDGQLADKKATLLSSKIKSSKVTASAVQALRRLQKNFKIAKNP